MPLDFQVEALIISWRNILEQLMHIPRRDRQSLIRDDLLREETGSRLSEMIHFRKADVTSKVLDPLPILFKEDLAFWWQPIPCQF